MLRHLIILILIISLYLPINSCSKNDSEQNESPDTSSVTSGRSAFAQLKNPSPDMVRELKNLHSAIKDMNQNNSRIINRQAAIETKMLQLANAVKGKNITGEASISINDFSGADHFILKAKQAEKSNPRLAELYYRGGISRLSDKNKVLEKFLIWMEKRIENDLKRKDYSAARAKADKLALVLDENSYQDNIESVPGYAQFYKRLGRLSKKISLYKKRAGEKQKKYLLSIENNIDQFDHRNLEQYKLAFKKISAMVPESMEIEQAAQILLSRLDLSIKAAQACTFSETDEPLIPPLEVPEAFGPWFTHILAYMENKQIPLNRRIKVWRDVNYLLSGIDPAKLQGDEKLIHDIKTMGIYLQVAGWLDRARLFAKKHFKSGSLSKQQLSDAFLLIQEGDRHFRNRPDLVTTMIKKFGAGYFEGLKDNIARNCQQLYASQFEAPVKIQINTAYISQSFQVYLEMKNFLKAYGSNKALLSTNEKIEKLMSGLTKYNESQRSIITANERKKLQNTEKHFIAFARKHIDDAWRVFNETEKSADKLTETWGSEKNQENLKQGLTALYGIDRNSLNLVDPGLLDEWKRIEWLLKREYKGKDNSAAEIIYARTKKKRVEDFE